MGADIYFPIFLSIIIFFFPSFSFAQVAITEIMYDVEGTDTGREWIEIENTTDAPVDVSLLKLFEANTNHKITPVGESFLPARGFAVIADNVDKFRVDNPTFSGFLFDSVFSLSNEGETLVLRTESLSGVDSVTYVPSLGGAGDGNTLQKLGSTFIAAQKTPGNTASGQSLSSQNSTTTNTVENSTESASVQSKPDSYSTHSSQAPARTSLDVEEFEVTSGRPRIGFVGTPLSFEAKIKTAKNLESGSLQGLWSFGDGSEQAGNKVSHVYEYPGEYIVILNAHFANAEAVSKTKVTIREPRIVIHADNPLYVEVENISDFELNVGGWILENSEKRFIIPKDTLISKKSSIKISNNISGVSTQKEYVRIANPTGGILANVYTHTNLSQGDVSVSPHNTQLNKQESVVLLPEGVNEAIFRDRLARLSRYEEQKIFTNKNKKIIDTTPDANQTTILVHRDSVGTSTINTASVIYTIADKQGGDWLTTVLKYLKK